LDPEGRDVPLGVGIDSLEDLARALRQRRRRHARQHCDTELTYRELAARSGYAHGVIGDYFTGKILPPTDRLDVLVVLLGAAGEEQSAFATARDRIEEHRRQTGRRADGQTGMRACGHAGMRACGHAGWRCGGGDADAAS
jgi:Helix-turn-helix domain